MRRLLPLTILSLVALQCTTAQSAPPGPPAWSLSTRIPRRTLGTVRPSTRPRSPTYNVTPTTTPFERRLSTALPVVNRTLQSNKVSVQLSKVIQNQAATSFDRSFSNRDEDAVLAIRLNAAENATAGSTAPLNYPLPQRQHFKPGKLVNLLEGGFDPLWVSIEKPFSQIERPPAASVIPDPDLTDKLSALNFSYFTLYDSVGQPMQPQPGLVSLFKTWLHRFATCQIEYVWEEMDIRVWPRYVKRGACVSTQACSWPPGMKCKPSQQRSVKLLRWMCEALENNENNIKTTSRTVVRRNSPNETIPAARRNGIQKKAAEKVSNKRKTMNDYRKARKKGVDAKGGKKGQLRGQKEKRNAFITDPDTTYLQDNILCQWKLISYSVVEKCSCSCATQ